MKLVVFVIQAKRSMVFYRKYRPQTIDELDLLAVREKLSSILVHTNLPHAFLFTGPKGLGKTSSARILAKAINCEKRNQESGIRKNGKKNAENQKTKIPNSSFVIPNSIFEPCNVCDACISITNGSNLDVLEIDAASNRGIDEIRDLRDKVKFAPASLRKKVYIIDEVHMLTTEAFNALLKTLEEPPDHVVFILCTTEFWKLPGTIVSRAFHVQFEKPTVEEIARSLLRVVEGEKLKVEDGVLEKIFSLADGAFRDATKILEELALAAPDKKITLEILEKAYKTDSIDGQVAEIIAKLSVRDTKEALKIVESLASNGCDFKVVIEKMVDRLRSLLLITQGLGGEVTVHSARFTVKDLEHLLELCSDAYKNLKFAVIPQLPLELLIVKWCVLDEGIGESSQFTVHGSQEKNRIIPATASLEATERSGKAGVQGNGNTNSNGASPNSSFIIPNSNSDFLKNLIELVKKDNFTIAGVLRSCSLLAITDSGVELSAPFKFHGDKLREAKTMTMLETHAKELLGRDIRFIITVKGE